MKRNQKSFSTVPKLNKSTFLIDFQDTQKVSRVNFSSLCICRAKVHDLQSDCIQDCFGIFRWIWSIRLWLCHCCYGSSALVTHIYYLCGTTQNTWKCPGWRRSFSLIIWHRIFSKIERWPQVRADTSFVFIDWVFMTLLWLPSSIFLHLLFAAQQPKEKW